MKLGKAFEKDILAGVCPPIVSLLSSYCLDMSMETGYVSHEQKHSAYETDVEQQARHGFSKQLTRRLFSAFHITMQELLCLNTSVTWNALGEFAYNAKQQSITFKYAPERNVSPNILAGTLSVDRETVKPPEFESAEITTEMLVDILKSRFCQLFASSAFHQAIENVAVLPHHQEEIDLNIKLDNILTRWAQGCYELLSLFLSEACQSVSNRNNSSVIIDDFGRFYPSIRYGLEFTASQECIDFIHSMRQRLNKNQVLSPL